VPSSFAPGEVWQFVGRRPTRCARTTIDEKARSDDGVTVKLNIAHLCQYNDRVMLARHDPCETQEHEIQETVFGPSSATLRLLRGARARGRRSLLASNGNLIAAFKTYDELNAWLPEKSDNYAKLHLHPDAPPIIEQHFYRSCVRMHPADRR
jgi:hypothetical protein